MKRNFREMLEAKWAEGKFVCVGLDSEVSKLPGHLRRSSRSLAEIVTSFNKDIIEATHDLVLAYKPNAAFYEEWGNIGWKVLGETIRTIRRFTPNVPIILDAKRADIGNTNNGYVKMAFEDLGVDAITVHPYLGGPDALKPFLAREDKGVIVLCRTSNPGAREFQDLLVNVPEGCIETFTGSVGSEVPKTIPLWKYVAHRVSTRGSGWNVNGNCAVVVGATYPDELREVRGIVGDMPILIPGIGAQGGDVEKTVKAGADSRGRGMIINSSRGIIFASSGPDYAEAARLATLELHTLITRYLPQEVAK